MKRQKSEPQTWPDTWTGRTMMSINRFARSALVLMLALLTVQSAWGMTWEVSEATWATTITANKYSGTLIGVLATNTGDLAATPFNQLNSLATVESASPYWTFELGIGVTNFDYNSTPTGNLLDGVTDASIGIRGRHLELPLGHTENLGYGASGGGFSTHFSAVGDSTTRAPNAKFRMVASGSMKHYDDHPHKDRFSVSAIFKVDGGVVPTEPFILTPLGQPTVGEDNIKIDARHPGSGPKVPTGRTVGTTDTSLFYQNSSQELYISLNGIDILSTTPTTTAVIDPEYAGDSLASTASPPMLPSIAAAYAGFNDGMHSFTPVSYFPGANKFPIETATGDSSFLAEWGILNINPVTGEAQALLDKTTYSERYGEAGDNPSAFLGDLIDEHFFDPIDTQTDGLMFTFDATALLSGSNNFTNNYDSFGAGDQTTFTISGAAIVPEPTTLVLLSIGMLLVGLRRGAGHREQGR